MRLLNRLCRARHHARVVPVVVVPLVSLLAIASATAAAEPEVDAREEPRKALFYTGIETEPVRGSTEITGTRASVRLGPVLQGDQVRHDFWIDNPRDVDLELRDVTACSGCILLDHSRSVAPGGRGRIAILIVTDSRGGETIEGTIRAETDDPARPLIEIDVSMEVREFAALSPYRVWLEGRAGEEIVAKTTVVPNASYPFDITGIKTRRGAYFDLAWEKTTVDGRPGWEITLTNTRTRPGPYQDVLYIQTDNPARPELEVRVEGRIAEPGSPSVERAVEEESPGS